MRETPDQVAFRFLADYHNGDEELIRGWRRNADLRWCLTLQLCQSYADEVQRARTLERTTELRWRMVKTAVLHPMTGDATGVKETPVLEQGWFCRETGETEWRKVPFVY